MSEMTGLQAGRVIGDVGLQIARRPLVPGVRSRSVGFGSAAIRATRGLRCSATRLIVPPLPAASRPSKITTSRAPSARTYSCSLTNSTCRRRSSFSYTSRQLRRLLIGHAASTTDDSLSHFRPR